MQTNIQGYPYTGGKPLNRYYGVEFSVSNEDCLRQFRIWKTESEPMCVLVKEDSKILKSLKEGDVMCMTYYSRDAKNPTQVLDTEIKRIRKEDDGRFQGHFLIELGIRDIEGSPSPASSLS